MKVYILLFGVVVAIIILLVVSEPSHSKKSKSRNYHDGVFGCFDCGGDSGGGDSGCGCDGGCCGD